MNLLDSRRSTPNFGKKHFSKTEEITGHVNDHQTTKRLKISSAGNFEIWTNNGGLCEKDGMQRLNKLLDRGCCDTFTKLIGCLRLWPANQNTKWCKETNWFTRDLAPISKKLIWHLYEKTINHKSANFQNNFPDWKPYKQTKRHRKKTTAVETSTTRPFLLDYGLGWRVVKDNSATRFGQVTFHSTSLNLSELPHALAEDLKSKRKLRTGNWEKTCWRTEINTSNNFV